jgi:methionyl-tRNA formyltransferase
VLDRLPRDLEPGRIAPADQVGGAGGVAVTCRRGAVELLVVRPAGKRSMAAVDWLRGLRAAEGRFLCPGNES